MMPPGEADAQASPEQSSMLMAKEIANDLALVSALWRFGKRCPEDKGGAGRDQRANLTGLGSDRFAHSLALLASHGLIGTRYDDVGPSPRLARLRSQRAATWRHVMQAITAREATVLQQYRRGLARLRS